MQPLRPSTALRAILLITALACNFNSVVYAQANEVDKLADAIGKMLKAFGVDNDVGEEAFAGEAVFGQPAAVMPEAELKQREARLKAYSETAADWLNDQLDLQPDQLTALKTTLEDKITATQKRPNVNNGNMNRGFSDHFAINFTDRSGAARELNFLQQEKLLTAINLTPEQQAALDEAKKERQAFHEAATIGHVLNQLDEELYLTAAQRTSLAEVVKQKVDLKAACYALTPMDYYFDQKPISPAISAAKKMLGAAQKQRAEDLASQDRDLDAEQYINFQSDEGVELWQKKLQDAMKAQRARVMRAVAVRVEFYQASCDMSDSDARHLLVAGKGATEGTMAQWKTTSSQQLKSYEEHVLQNGNGNWSFSVSVPDVQQIDSHSLWKHTVEQLLPTASDQLTQRNEVRAAATANFIVAMLDRELWLTQRQRNILIEAVRKELPSPNTRIQNANYYLEVTLLTIPMFKLSKQELTVLTDSQKAAFNQMKKPFEMQNNYIVVKMKNGGQMHLSIPK